MRTDPRRHFVRGTTPPLIGFETSREGERIELNVAPAGWPFPRLRSFERRELMLVAGREDALIEEDDDGTRQ